MSGAGSALMGIGSSRGDRRAIEAAEMAISSPLLEASIDGAHGVLLSISGGSDLGLFEIDEAAQLVATAAHADANIIFGAVIDDALGDEVRVTVIAAGFDGGTPRRQTQPGTTFASTSATTRRAERPAASTMPKPNGYDAPTPAPRTAPVPQPEREPASVAVGAGDTSIRLPRDEPVARRAAAARPSRTIVFDDSDELDVPDFLK
jgi:cell division protein FtsZ